MTIKISGPILDEEEKKAVIDVLDSGQLSQGEKVKQLEKLFAKYIGTKYAIALNSGTAALHLALIANEIGEGDEVITSPFSFVASASSILMTKAKPVFVDIEEDSFNINPDLIKEKITNKTKAVIPVHLFGYPSDMEKIIKIAKEHNLTIIEDACQAHGAKIGDKNVGTFGIGCFSFYPTKNITTGEGGMITTNDEKIDDLIRKLRNHGSLIRYHHDILGYNYRMTELSAAIGIAQLKKLEFFNSRRIENALYLKEKIKIPGIVTPKLKNRYRHVFHQFTIRVTKKYKMTREKLIKKLKQNDIECEIYYPIPIHKQTLFKKLGYDEKLPICEKITKEVLSLPIHPSVLKNDLNKIIDILGE
jgi:dTDP-4-amino-4,6-dideoxygalactose transaminase